MLSLHKIRVDCDEDAVIIAAYYFQVDTAECYSHLETVTSRWMGGGVEDFGLVAGDAVGVEQFQNLLAGYDKEGSIFTVRAPELPHVAGFDMTFSLVKSRSLLRAAADKETRVALDERLLAAVETTLRYAEENGYFIQRMGAGGKSKIPAKVTAAAFVHHTNRDGDPHDHLHLVVLNAAWRRRDDANGGRLECKQIFHAKLEVGAVFRAELAKLDRELGFATEIHGRLFQYRGISPEAIAYYSKGSRRIRDRVGAAASAKSKQIAALDTRPEKVYSSSGFRDQVHRAELLDKFGIDLETVSNARSLPAASGAATKPPFDLNDVIDTLASHYSDFRLGDIRREIALAAVGFFGTDGIRDLTRMALASPRVIKTTLPVYVRDEETGQFKVTQAERYTTRENYSADRRIAAWAKDASGRREHVLPFDVVRHAITEFEAAQGIPLSNEQFQAVLGITTGRDFVAVEGGADVGQRTVLSPVAMAYRAAGYRVLTISDKKVIMTELGQKLAVENITLANFILDTLGQPGSRQRPMLHVDTTTLIILDRGAEVGSLGFERLRQAIEPRGAKFLLLGGRKRSETTIGAKAWSIILDKSQAVIALRETPRTSDTEYGQKLTDRSRVPSVPALVRLAEAGDLIVAADDGLSHAVKKFQTNVEKFGLENSFVLTQTTFGARRVNEAVRGKLRDQGMLGSQDFAVRVTAPDGSGAYEANISVGDRIITRGRHQDLVKHGKVYIITGIVQKESGRLEIEMKRPEWKAKTIKIDTQDFSKFHHSYAATSTISHDQTKIGVTYWIESGNKKHLVNFYITLSRGRHAPNIVASSHAISDLAAQQILVNLTPHEAAYVILDAVRDQAYLKKTTTDAQLETRLPGTLTEQIQFDNELHEQLRSREYQRMRREQRYEAAEKVAGKTTRQAEPHDQTIAMVVDCIASADRDGRLDKTHDFARHQKTMRAIELAERRLLTLIQKDKLDSKKKLAAAQDKVNATREAHLTISSLTDSRRSQFMKRCNDMDVYLSARTDHMREWRRLIETRQPSLEDMARMTKAEYIARQQEFASKETLLFKQGPHAMEPAGTAWHYAPAKATVEKPPVSAQHQARRTYSDELALNPENLEKFKIHPAAIDRVANIAHTDMTRAHEQHAKHTSEAHAPQDAPAPSRRSRISGVDM